MMSVLQALLFNTDAQEPPVSHDITHPNNSLSTKYCPFDLSALLLALCHLCFACIAACHSQRSTWMHQTVLRLRSAARC